MRSLQFISLVYYQNSGYIESLYIRQSKCAKTPLHRLLKYWKAENFWGPSPEPQSRGMKGKGKKGGERREGKSLESPFSNQIGAPAERWTLPYCTAKHHVPTITVAPSIVASIQAFRTPSVPLLKLSHSKTPGGLQSHNISRYIIQLCLWRYTRLWLWMSCVNCICHLLSDWAIFRLETLTCSYLVQCT